MTKIFNLIALLILPAVGWSQEILSPQPLAKLITRFPFKQYIGGVMVIQARIGNLPDTLNFILDTGSGGISLDSSTCARLAIHPRQSDTTITGMGGAHKVMFVHNRQLQLPGLSLDHLNFHVNDYDVLTSVYGEKIDGIIGYSFFSKYIVKIDFDKWEIAVYSPGEIEYPKSGTILRPAFTRLPILNLTIKDRKKSDFNFYFDTGAGLCFLMSEKFAKDSNILHSKRKPLVTQAEGMGGRLQMRLTVVKLVQVGNYKFRTVPTYLYKDEYNVTAYPQTGGLLGNDLLRRFNLTVNYPKREIHLSPNSHFLEPFDYSYTGLALYFEEGKIIVGEVMADSPALKAGVKKDDVVVGVGTNFSNNIMQYKTALQTANEKIQMVVKREGELKQLTIKPINIL